MYAQPQKITLKDIAQASGYSLTTVHRAMNHKEGVSRSVQKEILDLARDMGYTTNYVAAALKRRQVNIAIVMPTSDKSGKHYFQYIWNGCHESVEEFSGYNINCIDRPFEIGMGMQEEVSKQLEILQDLYDNWIGQLDGLIFSPHVYSEKIELVLNKFSTKGVPVVLIDNDLKNSDRMCCVAPNDVHIGRLAGEFLSMALANRKGKILLLTGDTHSDAHRMNEQGFFECLTENSTGLEVVPVPEHLQDKEKTLQELFMDPQVIAAYSVRARNTIPMCVAAQASGRLKDITLVGSDLFPQSACMLKEGVLKAIIYKNPYEKGKIAYKILFDVIFKGTKLDSDLQYVPISIILKTNLPYFERLI